MQCRHFLPPSAGAVDTLGCRDPVWFGGPSRSPCIRSVIVVSRLSMRDDISFTGPLRQLRRRAGSTPGSQGMPCSLFVLRVSANNSFGRIQKSKRRRQLTGPARSFRRNASRAARAACRPVPYQLDLRASIIIRGQPVGPRTHETTQLPWADYILDPSSYAHTGASPRGPLRQLWRSGRFDGGQSFRRAAQRC